MERSFRHLQKKTSQSRIQFPDCCAHRIGAKRKTFCFVATHHRHFFGFHRFCTEPDSQITGHFEHTSPIAIFDQSTWEKKWGGEIAIQVAVAITFRALTERSGDFSKNGSSTCATATTRSPRRRPRLPRRRCPERSAIRETRAYADATQVLREIQRASVRTQAGRAASQDFLGCHSSIFVPSGSTIQANFPATSSWLRLRTVTPLASIRARNASRSSTAKSTMNSRVDGAM